MFHPSDLIAYRVEPIIKCFNYDVAEFEHEEDLKEKLISMNCELMSKEAADHLQDELEVEIEPPHLIPYYKRG